MTDTTTITAEDSHGGDDNATPAPVYGTLEHLNPNDLVVDTNVRNDAAVDADFLANVKEHGVITPITAVREDDGTVRVRTGQRRTLAARQAGLNTVPVYVRPASSGDEKAQVVERVAEQIVENDQRKALSDAQRARGIQQMIDAGLSLTKVAKKLSVAKDVIKAAETAAKSSAALEALDRGQISLTEAAALTEFEQDGPEVLARLEAAAGSAQFDHVVSKLRTERASAQAYAAAVAGYTEQGYTVLDDHPRKPWGDTSFVPVSRLRTPEGGEVTEAAITDPAHWAVLLYEDTGWADRDSGELVDESTIDWDTEDDPDATPAEGMRHVNSVVETTVFDAEWFCTDYAAAGLELSAAYRGNADAEAATDADGSSADAEAARLQREAEQAQAEKRERRKVLALNKLGAAAGSVRREFVTKLLARKTSPKGAGVFIAECLTRDKGLLNEYHGDEMAAELLGVSDTDALRMQVKALGTNGDARAQVIMLALVLGALENRTPKDAWRNPGSGWLYFIKGTDYLQFLAAQGYTLSPIEEVISGKADADTVFDDQASSQEATD